MAATLAPKAKTVKAPQVKDQPLFIGGKMVHGILKALAGACSAWSVISTF
jgi:hypothetical protein